MRQTRYWKSCGYACVVALATGPAPAPSQTYPAKAVHLVVPYTPGGGVDATARTIGQKLTEFLGQPVIVDNRPGAAGTVGADYVAKSAPDGYVLLVGGRGPTSAAPLMYKKLPYVPARDLTAVSNLVLWPYILVTHPSIPARNAKELIALAKSRPGELNMASGGAGSGQHICGELFNLMAGSRMTHVPYKGTGPAINDIMGGHADLGFLDPAVLPQIRAGRLKALGVSSDRRYEPLPNVPPISESGLPGYVAITWYGLMAPAATPRNVIARLNADVGRALAQPEVKEKLLAQGLIASPSTPEQLTARIRADSEVLEKLIRATGIQIN
jgi:tripartite-type tricarboxylate transporter receptor subunit TctC